MGKQTFLAKLEIEESLRIKIIQALDKELRATTGSGLSQRYKDIIFSVSL